MNRPRLIRGIKITWTVFCGIACVLLVVLWVRSYWWNDTLLSRSLQVSSVYGGIAFVDYAEPTPVKSWYFDTRPSGVRPWRSGFALRVVRDDFGWAINFPTWLPAILFAVIGTAPWGIGRRFSLRTLLIATTLVAVVLGLIVWFSR